MRFSNDYYPVHFMGIDFRNSEPFYQQIVTDIKRQIEAGELAVDDRLGSHRELAQHYGVSLITVKKALTELIREGLLYARVGKGTFVARTERPVNHRDHRSIGVVLRDLDEPFFSEITRVVEDLAYEAGYNIMLSVSAGRREKEAGQIRHFRSIGVDGLLIASMHSSHRAPRVVRELHTAHFPYVMVSYVADADMYYVGVDHEEGAYLATTHLLKQGRTRIGYMGTPPDDLLSALRETGYRRALEAQGHPYRRKLVYPVLTGSSWERYDAAYAAGRNIARQQNPPDAFFVYNDAAAVGLLRALLDAGLRIPDDVAVVGFDDIQRAAYAPVPLTTVRQPTETIGRLAIETILRRIGRQPVEPRVVLPPELVIRESCGASVTASKN